MEGLKIKDIYRATLLDLAPSSKKYNSEDIIFYKIIDKIIDKYIIKNIEKVIFLDNLNDMDEIFLDLAADELHIESYNTKLSLEQKKFLIKNSIKNNTAKGTKNAILNTISTFYKNVDIKEWHKYNGEQGKYRIEIADDNIDYFQISKINSEINKVKRISQHLDKISFIKKDKFDLKIYAFQIDRGKNAYCMNYLETKIKVYGISHTLSKGVIK